MTMRIHRAVRTLSLLLALSMLLSVSAISSAAETPAPSVLTVSDSTLALVDRDDLNGGDWYLGLAAPIILWGGAILLLLGLVLRVYRRSALTTLTILIGSIGVFVFGMEFFVDRWLHQLWSPSWSLVVLTICIGMVIPLIIIRRVPALREEARRRFHL